MHGKFQVIGHVLQWLERWDCQELLYEDWDSSCRKSPQRSSIHSGICGDMTCGHIARRRQDVTERDWSVMRQATTGFEAI